MALVIRQRTSLCREYLRSKSVDTPVAQNQAKVSEYEGWAAFLSRFDKQLAIDNIKILSQHVSQLGTPSIRFESLEFISREDFKSIRDSARILNRCNIDIYSY